MSKLTALISLIFFCVFSTVSLADEAAIKQVLEKQRQAWNEGDLEAFMQGYWQSEELMFIGRNGIKKGWQTTLDNYKKSYSDKASMGTLFFDVLDVQVEGDSAFVLGKWKVVTTSGQSNGFYTLYWKNIAGEWKIVIDHSS